MLNSSRNIIEKEREISKFFG